MNTYDGNYEKLMEDYEDIQFRVGLWKYAESVGRELIAENEQLKNDRQHELTPEAIKNMDAAVGRGLRKRHLKNAIRAMVNARNKVAASLVISVALFASLAISVEAIRVSTLNFLLKFQNKTAELRIDSAPDSGMVGDRLYMRWKNSYVPTYLPEGFEINILKNEHISQSIYYENKNAEVICFTTYLDEAYLEIDTENAIVNDVMIGGASGTLIETEGLSRLIWSENGTVFELIAQIEPSEIVKIAESLVFIE